ncbi:uncharacterized protein [Amphiura filiformis]|uniref:uncharacterized protein n=1 Tax=Amphiura filiformis TaxID=82378 RepID=UPI003B20D015
MENDQNNKQHKKQKKDKKVNGEEGKKRNKNFSEEEVFALIEFIKEPENGKALFSAAKHSSGKVEKRKTACWGRAAKYVRATSQAPTERTGEEMRTKWSNLKTNALRYEDFTTNKTGEY